MHIICNIHLLYATYIYTQAHTFTLTFILVSVYWNHELMLAHPIPVQSSFSFLGLPYFIASLAPFSLLYLFDQSLYGLISISATSPSPGQPPLFGLWVPIQSHSHAALLPSITHCRISSSPCLGRPQYHAMSAPPWTSSSSGFGSASSLPNDSLLTTSGLGDPHTGPLWLSTPTRATR